jgi:hypothetical protein
MDLSEPMNHFLMTMSASSVLHPATRVGAPRAIFICLFFSLQPSAFLLPPFPIGA